MDEMQKGEILVYQSESGDTKIDVYLGGEELFGFHRR